MCSEAREGAGRWICKLSGNLATGRLSFGGPNSTSSLMTNVTTSTNSWNIDVGGTYTQTNLSDILRLLTRCDFKVLLTDHRT